MLKTPSFWRGQRSLALPFILLKGTPKLELYPQHRERSVPMSRFRKLTHTIWHCQYHIVWVPMYRYRVLSGPIGEEAYNCFKCLVVRRRVRSSSLTCSRTMFTWYRWFHRGYRYRICSANSKGERRFGFWKSICISNRSGTGAIISGPQVIVLMVGLNAEMIRKYVKYQEQKERDSDQLGFNF